MQKDTTTQGIIGVIGIASFFLFWIIDGLKIAFIFILVYIIIMCLISLFFKMLKK